MSTDDTDRQLWQRYVATAEQAFQPDALMLAAYADRTLDQTETELVEAWLARNPDQISWIIEARRANQDPAPLQTIRRARSLVSATARRDRALAAWQPLAGWCAVAAALVMICMTGLEMTFVHHGVHQQVDDVTLIDLGTNVGAGAGDGGSLL